MEAAGITGALWPVSAARTRRMVGAFSPGMFCKDTVRLWRLYLSQHDSIYETISMCRVQSKSLVVLFCNIYSPSLKLCS